ncbi:MAG: type IV secretion system protein VirB10 [Burkholderiales bacterium]|nr:type IV secretion system protein VirB10 [Burkholderiales bacterium]
MVEKNTSSFSNKTLNLSEEATYSAPDNIKTSNQIKPHGIPSIKSKKKKVGISSQAILWIVVLCAVIPTLAWLFQYKKANNDEEAKDPPRITSTQTLTLPPLSAFEVPVEKPKAEPQPEPQKEVAAKPPETPLLNMFKTPEPAPQQTSVTTVKLPAEAPQEDEGPTLEQKKFSAPMMGPRLNNVVTESGMDTNKNVQSRGGTGKLGDLLTPTITPNGFAQNMGNRSLLLSKGTFIDCILETKLDTTVPGMTSCILPQNIYSANGKVVLMEKGSKAIGEYKGAVENGLNRIFVLWTEIQTPIGISVVLDSPTADSLGGSGMAGEIDFHWWKRFGNALLFTLVQDAFEFGIAKESNNNGGVNYYSNTESGMQDIIREAMKQSGNIPPTLTKNQGERIGIFVARDVDFSSVYKLTPSRKLSRR